MIPYGRQDIQAEDIQAVLDVLKSDFLTQGPAVPRFEWALAQKVGAKHAIAVNSATSALHIACLALGLGRGDWLWTSPITFVASANCGLYCGAKVDFVDIDPRTFNISPQLLEHKLQQAERDGRLPKVLVAVHLCGQPCDMKALAQLADRFDFRIIEDASHAVGGQYEGSYIGSGRYSDITVFSFHPVKIITTAEGGMALTNNEVLANEMTLLKGHGITRDPEQMTRQPDGPWYYEQITLGFNFRMTELQAALGLSQLARLDEYVARRHELAQQYDERMKHLPVTTQAQFPPHYSARHLYCIRLQFGGDRKRHRAVFESMRAQGIGVNLHYIPVHLQPYYRKMGFKEGDFPSAEAFYAEAISLPMYPTLTEYQLRFVTKVLSEAILK